MLREHSNRNYILRAIKCPLFPSPIIKPGNHRWDQDHILQDTAHTSRMRQTFLSSQTEREGETSVQMRKSDCSPLATLVRDGGAEPSSLFTLTATQSGQYCLQVSAAAQRDCSGCCYSMRPSWAALFSALEPRGVGRGLLTCTSRYTPLVCGFASYQPVWGCTWYLTQGQMEVVY